MNPNKFSFAQMTSNSSNGKTSAGKAGGVWLLLVGSIMLLWATFVIRDVAVLNAVLFAGAGVITAGTGLIIGKVVKPTNIKDETDIEKNSPEG